MDMTRAHSVVSFLVRQMDWEQAGQTVFRMEPGIPKDSPIRRAALIVCAEYCLAVSLDSKAYLAKNPNNENAAHNAEAYKKRWIEYTAEVAAMDEAERASNPPHPALVNYGPDPFGVAGRLA